MAWFKRNKIGNSKSHCPSSAYRYNNVYDALVAMQHYDLAAFQAVKYYMKTAPLYTAIDIIASEVASITPVVENTEGELIPDHPVIELLRSPNDSESYHDFVRAFASYLLITGENYTIATGLKSRPPQEILIAPPQAMNIETGSDRTISAMIFNTATTSMTFFKENGISAKLASTRDRYFTKTELQEIWQTITFNPSQQHYRIRGLSPFTPLFYQIEQYIKSDIHNLSILNKGGRISGAFIFENSLTDEQFTRIKQQINNIYAGAENAGRMAVLDGDKITYEELGMSLKDMDFATLKDRVETAIYNALHLPLPMIKSEQMTLANMATAKLSLYDNAVLPLAKRIFEELTLMLMYRYPNSEDLSITFQAQSIPALETRRVEQLVAMSTLGILTINEMRSRIGFGDIDGGESIFRPATDIPIATEGK